MWLARSGGVGGHSQGLGSRAISRFHRWDTNEGDHMKSFVMLIPSRVSDHHGLEHR